MKKIISILAILIAFVSCQTDSVEYENQDLLDYFKLVETLPKSLRAKVINPFEKNDQYTLLCANIDLSGNSLLIYEDTDGNTYLQIVSFVSPSVTIQQISDDAAEDTDESIEVIDPCVLIGR
ncbi:hypothetical protein EZY14_009235 [Kordia sp. TARA_039_SRF]|nr:hypothetical protein EZY14_009235 [Kordia sp. TARA_039_SRF]